MIIPARYDSSRFPGKPLVDLLGKTMIQRVYEQATQSKARSVVVATDDDRILDEVDRFGGIGIMTAREHVSGTDRIHEAVMKLGLPADDVVVNVQGDEPLIPPAVIDRVASLISEDVRMATLCEPIAERDDVFNPDIVKLVRDKNDVALYFSRAPIPWHRDQFMSEQALSGSGWYRHLGIYAYSVSLLEAFVNWEPAILELTESLEQLRALANGEKIRVIESGESMPPGIDTPEDVARTLAALRG